MVPHNGHIGLRIWTDIDRSRYFLIPDEVALSPGPCMIRTITGKRQSIDPEVLAQFEITRIQAEEWLKGQLDSAAQGLKTAVANIVSQWKAASAQSHEEVEALLNAARMAEKDPVLAARHAQALEQLAASLEQKSGQAAAHLRAAAEDLWRRAGAAS